MSSQIENEWKEVKSSYVKLGDLEIVDEGWQAEGKIEIIDSSGILWKTFSVRILIPSKYPNILPSIYETGGEIPIEPDWHINFDGSCCVGPNTKIYRKLDFKITLKRWLDIVVLPFLFDQVYKLEKGEYIGKEHAHGNKGLIEDYKEWWRLESQEDVVNKLKLITKKNKYPRNEPCFCGSKLKYKKCHLFSSMFNNIPIEIYKTDLYSILNEKLRN